MAFGLSGAGPWGTQVAHNIVRMHTREDIVRLTELASCAG